MSDIQRLIIGYIPGIGVKSFTFGMLKTALISQKNEKQVTDSPLIPIH